MNTVPAVAGLFLGYYLINDNDNSPIFILIGISIMTDKDGLSVIILGCPQCPLPHKNIVILGSMLLVLSRSNCRQRAH